MKNARKRKRVVVACECSGRVRKEFSKRGHVATSCDLQACDNPDWPGRHVQCDIFELLESESFDLMIAHPPCTFLASSGLHWNGRVDGRSAETEAALEFVRRLMCANVPEIAIENPRGCISTRIRPADQYIQPYQFGDDASKCTGLWLKRLPPLRPTAFAMPRRVDTSGDFDLFGESVGIARWSNQTDSGQNRLPPSSERAKIRSETYRGIAAAMADQWGGW